MIKTPGKTPARKVSRPSGKSPAELVRASNRWRDTYNPLRGLVISRVVTILEAAERGDYAELQLTLRKIEKRFPIYKALRSRRQSAIGELDWDIKTVSELPAGATEAMAKKQAEHLRSRYELITNLREAIAFLGLSEFRGYSILQKHFYTEGENDGAVRELHWLPQWNFCRDGQFGDWYYNKDAQFGIGLDSCKATLGEENRIGSDQLPLENFLIRECEAPLYEIALVAFVNWSMARKDNAAFVEIFGLPNAIVIMPPNIPTEKEEEYQAAAEKVADGASGALPNGGDAKFPTASVRGNAPFKEFCDAQEADVVLAGTGGLLTMLSQPTGIGQGASEEHGDAFKQIACMEAKEISEIFQRSFDDAELTAAFPNEPHLVYFELAADESDDENTVTDRVQKLENAGYATDPKEVSEKTGLTVTRKQVAPTDPNQPTPGFPIRNRSEVMPDAAPLARAVVTDLQPAFKVLAERAQRIAEIVDPELRRQKTAELGAEMDQLAKDVSADSETAKVLQKQNAAALAKGLTT